MLPVSDVLASLDTVGAEASLQEAAPDRFGLVRTPRVVVWNVCPHCNQRCPHCYAAAVQRATPDTLTSGEALSLLDRLAEGGVRQLVLSGGEPLLREDLESLAARARELGMRVHLSSNGTRLSRTRAAALAEAGVEYVGVSLDGMAAFHDAWRGSPRGYERALRGLRYAMDAGMRTGVRITVTSDNAGQLFPLLEEAVGWGVDRFYVSHLLPSGRASELREAYLDRASRRALVERLFEWAEAAAMRGERTRLVTGGNDSDGPLLLLWVERRHGAERARRVERVLRARGGNSAGERILCVDHRGVVFPDQFWRTAPVGDLRSQSLREVLEHPLLVALRRRESMLRGRCRVCRFLPLCRGSHRERAEWAYGSRWAPDPACHLIENESNPSPASSGA